MKKIILLFLLNISCSENKKQIINHDKKKEIVKDDILNVILELKILEDDEFDFFI